MTITTTDSFVRYTGDGTETQYSFAFKCFSTDDLRVITDDGDTADTSPSYTVALNADQDANPGGTLTFGTAPGNGYEIYISSNIAAIQETDFRNATTFRAGTIEDWMDRMTLIIQQMQAQVDRCLKVGETTSGLAVSDLIDPGSVVMTLYMQGLAATISTAAGMRAEIAALSSAAGSVLTANIADDAVTTAKILDANVTNAKLVDGILSNDTAGRYKMAAGFLSANAAGRSKMADGYVTLAKLAAEVTDSLPSITMYTTETDGDFAITSAIVGTGIESTAFNHGLGAVPNLVVLQLVCVADSLGTSHGYTVGDVINLTVFGSQADAFSCDYDATRVVFKVHDSAIESGGKIKIRKKSLRDSFNSDKADWKMRAVCYKFGGML